MEYSDEEVELMNTVYGKFYRNKETYYKSSELEEEFELSGSELRSVIHNIRVEGFPIISNNNGYKYATNEKEINAFITSMFGRVASMVKVARGMIAARNEFFNGQLRMKVDQVSHFYNEIQQTINELEE